MCVWTSFQFPHMLGFYLASVSVGIPPSKSVMPTPPKSLGHGESISRVWETAFLCEILFLHKLGFIIIYTTGTAFMNFFRKIFAYDFKLQ